MASITELRVEVAKNIGTIPGLRTSPVMIDNPNPPIAIISPVSIDYDKSFGEGMTIYNYTVTVIVGRVSERTAQNSLDAYCSSTGALSIKKAVESNRTLSGKAFDLRVTGMRNYGSLNIADNEYLAAEFDLSVYAT
jgi:hypothetical protein